MGRAPILPQQVTPSAVTVPGGAQCLARPGPQGGLPAPQAHDMGPPREGAPEVCPGVGRADGRTGQSRAALDRGQQPRALEAPPVPSSSEHTGSSHRVWGPQGHGPGPAGWRPPSVSIQGWCWAAGPELLESATCPCQTPAGGPVTGRGCKQGAAPGGGRGWTLALYVLISFAAAPGARRGVRYGKEVLLVV